MLETNFTDTTAGGDGSAGFFHLASEKGPPIKPGQYILPFSGSALGNIKAIGRLRFNLVVAGEASFILKTQLFPATLPA